MLFRKTTTSTLVFVDKFVKGELPEVSVISGAPTRSRLTRSSQIDGPGPGWFLLILLGPMGWLVLAVVMVVSKRSHLVGLLPITKQEYLDYRSAKRRGAGVAAGGLVALLASLALSLAVELPGAALGLLLLLSAATLLSGAITYWVAQARIPKISLDGSRRWTTLHGVHPDFAAAVDKHDASVERVRRS